MPATLADAVLYKENTVNNLNPVQKAAIKLAIDFLNELSHRQGSAEGNEYSIENTDENWEIYKQSVTQAIDEELLNFVEEEERPKGNQIDCLDFVINSAVVGHLESILNNK